MRSLVVDVDVWSDQHGDRRGSAECPAGRCSGRAGATVRTFNLGPCLVHIDCTFVRMRSPSRV